MLGCGGLGGFDKELEAELGVPVIDGIVAAVKLAEGDVRLRRHDEQGRAIRVTAQQANRGLAPGRGAGRAVICAA